MLFEMPSSWVSWAPMPVAAMWSALNIRGLRREEKARLGPEHRAPTERSPRAPLDDTRLRRRRHVSPRPKREGERRTRAPGRLESKRALRRQAPAAPALAASSPLPASPAAPASVAPPPPLAGSPPFAPCPPVLAPCPPMLASCPPVLAPCPPMLAPTPPEPPDVEGAPASELAGGGGSRQLPARHSSPLGQSVCRTQVD